MSRIWGDGLSQVQIDLFAAVFAGDIVKAREIVETSDIDSNVFDKRKWAPIHYAASMGLEMVIEVLISRGADVDLQNGVGSTALHIAAKRCHSGTCALLVELGARTDIRDKFGWLPLHHAAHHGSLLICQILVDIAANPADVNGYTDEDDDNITDWTPLHHACRNGHTTVVDFLLMRKARTSIRTRKCKELELGYPCFHEVCDKSPSELAKLRHKSAWIEKLLSNQKKQLWRQAVQKICAQNRLKRIKSIIEMDAQEEKQERRRRQSKRSTTSK